MLLRVEKPFKLNQEAVAPICLPNEDGSDDMSDNCYATGWGMWGFDENGEGLKANTSLYKVKLRTLSRCCEFPDLHSFLLILNVLELQVKMNYTDVYTFQN